MKIKVNKFVIEYLREFNVQQDYNGNRCIYKIGKKIDVPTDSFMEEYSSLNHTLQLCKTGTISYSWSKIPNQNMKIGRYCSIATGLRFIAEKHPLDLISTSPFSYNEEFYILKDSYLKYYGKALKTSTLENFIGISKPTILENDVYVCTDAILKPGITLHTGCVVGQNALVTKDVPPYAIVGGVPAKIIRYRFDEKTIERLLRLEWWQYHFGDFDGINLKQDINFYLDELENRIEKNQIRPFNPKKMMFAELIERSKQKIYTRILKKIF